MKKVALTAACCSPDCHQVLSAGERVPLKLR